MADVGKNDFKVYESPDPGQDAGALSALDFSPEHGEIRVTDCIVSFEHYIRIYH